jgi:acetolactate synthase I/II/III large subunit
MKRLLDETVSAAEAICRVLTEAGVDLVLGMPGGDVLVLFDALYDHRDAIRTVLVRDESQAAIMAEAYGRWTGKPAAVLAQGTWVLSKAAMGTLEALTGSSPMVILTDLSDKAPYSHLGPSQTGTGHYGTWDARRSFGGFMKEVMEAQHSVQAVQLTQLAVKHATTGCPGPVGIIYYGAALRGSVGPDTMPPLFSSAGYLQRAETLPGEDELRIALNLIGAAERPTIVAGNGVRLSRASDALIALAEALSAPVVTTTGGKGVIAETHSLAGGVMGDFGIDAANELVAEADLVLAVGTRLGPGDTVRHHRDLIDPGRQTIVQIDIEPRHVGSTMPVDCGLVGDAAVTLKVLLERARDDTPRREDGLDRVNRAMAAGGFESPESFSSERPMLPQRLVQLLFETLPDNAVVTADAGENRIFLNHHYRVKVGGGFLQPAATGAMGYAIASAMGVKLAEPDRPVVAVLGDGGFAMSVAGIMTALELDLGVVIIVLNNSMLGWVRHIQGNRIIASELGHFDHAAIARSLGCEGSRIDREEDFRPALEAALLSDRTTLIEVIVSGEESWEKVASSLRLPS